MLIDFQTGLALAELDPNTPRQTRNRALTPVADSDENPRPQKCIWRTKAQILLACNLPVMEALGILALVPPRPTLIPAPVRIKLPIPPPPDILIPALPLKDILTLTPPLRTTLPLKTDPLSFRSRY